MTPTLPTASARLGDFVARCDRADMPRHLRHEAQRSLVNYFGCALAVARDPAIATLVRVLSQLSGIRAATVIGRDERLDVAGAAFVNAAAANFLDYDDTHMPTIIHPTAPVAAAVLALCEARGSTGAHALLAFILGAEVECRIGNMVSPGHYARGWHITATCGALGAAAGCSRLLGLDGSRTAHAIGIAASMSSGLVENLAWPAKNVGVGNSARSGLLAALLAAEGCTAASTALEGPLGWARAMGDAPLVEPALAGLGSQWEFARNTYKPYPAGIVFHAVIEACCDLRSRHDLTAANVRNIVVSGDALLLARGDRPVHSERDARVSIHHSAAAVFVRGSAGLAEFSPAAVADPEVAAFRRKVRAERDDSLPAGAATVRVETQTGEVFTSTVLQPRGSESRPMTDDEIEKKATGLIRNGTAGIDPVALIQCIRDLEGMPSVAPLMTAAAAPPEMDRAKARTGTGAAARSAASS